MVASLFPEFLGAFLKHSSSAVFELLEDYQTLCQDKVGSPFSCTSVPHGCSSQDCAGVFLDWGQYLQSEYPVTKYSTCEIQINFYFCKCSINFQNRNLSVELDVTNTS